MELNQIAGEIKVRSNGNGYTARHLGRMCSCTMSREMAAIKLLEKVYGKRATYYLTAPQYHGDGSVTYDAVSARSVK